MTNLLIVDDEPSIRALCSRVLTDAGHVVDAAQGGEEAVARIYGASYDLVFSDLKMPGSPNGAELTRIIKQASPTTDIVIMTGYPTLESAVETIKLGALDYLVKPLDMKTILEVVKSSVNARTLSKEFNRELLLREELQAVYSELQDLDQMKDAFLSRLNHELRTPFMSAFYHLSQLPMDGIENQMHLIELRGGLDRLWALVKDLLLLSPLERGSVVLARCRTDVRFLLGQAVGRLKGRLEEKLLKIELELGQGDAMAWVDVGLLETAFKHLLLNAIQFNRRGGRVRIELKDSGETLTVSISDSGIGIPHEKLGRIFSSFYQVAEHLTREVGGMGIGLTIVKRIVESHGGWITASSQLGEGSVFNVTLPKQGISLRAAA